MGIPRHLIQLLKGLYEDQSMVIRTEFGDTVRFKIKKNSKTWLHLVSILIQPVCREDNEKGRNGRGKRRSENSRKDTEQFEICSLNNTDGWKKADLAKLIRRIKRKSEKAGLYFNIKKTKIITTANWDSFEIDGEEIEVVTSFTFLGSEVEKERRCDKEIKRRVAIGKATMIGLEKLWQDKHASIDTKKG